MEQEKAALENEVDSLNETIQILSDTINQKTQNENELSEQLQKQTTPTEFPLTGSATMEEVTEGNPMCIFTATDGAMVVATAAEAEVCIFVTVISGRGFIASSGLLCVCDR